MLSFDDRQGMNWLLKDRARVVVLPLQRCMRFLRRDPRLTALLPEGGAPLHWTVLVRPAGTREPLPRSWVQAAWEQPLLMRLLALGWRAPVKDPAPRELRSRLPSRWSSLLLLLPRSGHDAGRWSRSLPSSSQVCGALNGVIHSRRLGAALSRWWVSSATGIGSWWTAREAITTGFAG